MLLYRRKLLNIWKKYWVCAEIVILSIDLILCWIVWLIWFYCIGFDVAPFMPGIGTNHFFFLQNMW